jgi:chemotaxis protein CheX
MTIVISDDAISEVTHNTWQALLPDLGHLMPGTPCDGDAVIGFVEITGEFEGSISVACSYIAARRAAAVMFDVPQDRPHESQIDDAVGELVNVVGGSIKSMLPSPNDLSLPRVSRSTPGDFGSQLVARVDFTWIDEAIAICVWAS